MAAAASSSDPVLSPAEKARRIRDVADRVERGDPLSPALAELAERLAEEAEDAEVEVAAARVMDAHATILAALAK